MARRPSAAKELPGKRMSSVSRFVDLGEITAGELDDGCATVTRRVRADQYVRAGDLGLGQGRIEIEGLVAGQFSPIGVREMPIGHQYRDLAEGRFDADPSVRITRPADLDAGSLRVVTDHLAVREGDKATDEGIGAFRGHVDAVLRDGLELRVVRRRRMPVELHVD